MKHLSTAQAVRAVGRPIFTTGEIARLAHTPVSVTTRVLGSMARHGAVRRVTRGLWARPDDPRFSGYALVPYLAGGNRAYVSFHSALHLHGVIEQIPQIVYVAATGHTKMRKTALGAFSFHRLHPDFFGGFDWYGEGRDFLLATPEKALVDSLYLSTRRGRRFGSFPELTFGPRFSFRRAEAWVRRIPYGPIRRHVAQRLLRLRHRSAGSRPRSMAATRTARRPAPR